MTVYRVRITERISWTAELAAPNPEEAEEVAVIGYGELTIIEWRDQIRFEDREVEVEEVR